MSRLKELGDCGQAVWLDNLTRGWIVDGGLGKLIAEDGVGGVTSNPSIFEKAIAKGADYQAAIQKLLQDGDWSVSQIYEHLAIADIQNAADVLRPVYDRTGGADGYISLECSPYLANDTHATIHEARRLWQAVGRPNLMIKVPATPGGIPAIRELTAAGLNINITLLFAVSAYEQVAEAYLSGLEAWQAAGGDLSKIRSVASFFLSRIDSAVDARLVQLDDKQAGKRLAGRIAIANARIAYARYQALFSGARWQKLADAGAHTQKLLWASTGTKNSDYPDTLYIDALVGRDTVSTIPPATMAAFNAHGKIVPDAVEQDVDAARADLDALENLGISLAEITDELVVDGVQKFADSFDRLFAVIARARHEQFAARLPQQQFEAGSGELEQACAKELENWREAGRIRRLWAKDSQLWTGTDEEYWLGWLQAPQEGLAAIARLTAFAENVRQSKLRDVVLLGMGGSSLGAEVLANSLERWADAPRFHVLDSTDPMQIQTLQQALDLTRTLFIVSSKSGSTLEVNIFLDYFHDQVVRKVGKDKAGQHFIAITDPGSSLEDRANALQFQQIFHGIPEIGGRYSVLSNFGLVPAAAIGIDVHDLLRRSCAMQKSCAADVPPAENPAVQLGVAMAVAAGMGRDKFTVIASPAIAAFGAWLEQLLAESTGKSGTGLVPVADEPLVDAASYGDDRFFVHIELEEQFDAEQRALAAALQARSQPLVRIQLPDRRDLGQEFFRWELATAVAGAVLGVNPFDQPDVEASKVKTRELTDAMEKSQALPEESPRHSESGIRIYADDANAAALGAPKTLVDWLKAHFDRAGADDYVALLAYVERDAANSEKLQQMRQRILTSCGVATCLGFGPRFQHSTGQLYKGGRNSGVFLQITSDSAANIRIPGRGYGFQGVKMAQARGEFAVLAERGRRLLRIHLDDAEAGLETLEKALRTALD